MRADHDRSVSGSVSRRRAIKATAWSVPVISVAVTAPVAAASPTPGSGSIDVQRISLWGGGGQPAQGNFVVQAVSGVAGDTRTVVLTAVATLYRVVNGTPEVVGTLSVQPSASPSIALDGGSQQFNFNDSSLPLVTGTTYFVTVEATGTVSDGGILTNTGTSASYTAW